MRPILFFVLLCLFSNNASAEWVRIGVRFLNGTEYSDDISDNSIEAHESLTAFTVYANFSTMRKNWPKLKVWSLTNLSKTMKVTEQSYLSIKSHDEFDCKQRTSRSLSYSYFTDLMGKGELVLRSTRSTEWYPIEPNSITEIVYKTVCKKARF